MIRALIYRQSGTLEEIAVSELKKWNYSSKDKVWIDIYDEADEQTGKILKNQFGFHPLAIEDALKYMKDSKLHHPKIDDFDDYLFIVFNGILRDQQKLSFKYYSLSCFLGHNFLVTIHNEKPYNSIESSLRHTLNKTAFNKGPDYILHLIFDSIVDNYYPIMDDLEERINQVEETIFKRDSTNRVLATILVLKKELIRLMRFSSYQREVLFKLTRADSQLISAEESIYYRNVYDHLVRISDASESYRDYVTGVLESYLSIVSNRLNETMKFLTVMATILLPLTFITGVFGMNFDYIPFLHSEWGFWISMLGMLGVVVSLVVWFKRKKIL